MANDTASENFQEERHPTLWLEDGNVVLSAKSPNDNTRTLLFRVHRSVLARQSKVFADMFELPPSDSVDLQGLYEGVPRIDLHDSAEDLEEMLKVLYDPWYDLL